MGPMRHATAADLDAVIEVLIGAFDQDPFFRWMFSGDDFAAGLGEWFHLVVPITFTKGHTHLDTDHSAATVWLPPDVELARPEDYQAAAAIVARHSTSDHAAEVFQMIGAAGSHRPSAPNWQLVYIGVVPGAQGCGHGQQALAGTLSVCDAQGFPAYLHSTNPRNVPFYERLGFRVLTEVQTVEGGPVIRPMWREPRG